MAKKLVFENESCGRCGGSGRYSFNSIDGDMCYGCSGRGVKLTKRGAAAQKFFHDSLKKPLADIKPGMFIKESSGWLEVLEIGENPVNPSLIDVVTEKIIYCREKGTALKCVVHEEDFDTLRMNALSYQKTLG